MKWENKGHEFDGLVTEYKAKFFDKRFFVFGAGKVAASFTRLFQHFGCFEGFVDNNEKNGELCIAGVRLSPWTIIRKTLTIMVS